MSDFDKTFTVVLRGPSAVVFPKGKTLQASVPLPNYGAVTINYGTRWIKRDGEVEIPGQLWIEVRGSGDSLENVLMPFANAGLMPVPLLALSVNASIGEMEIEIGFETTPNSEERDYFQSYLPQETDAPHMGRMVAIEATAALWRAIAQHPDGERLIRAANHYRLALDSWKLGRESLSLAHLWMAIETLTKAVVRSQLVKHACKSEQELANRLGIELRQLEATIRKTIILKNDEECYRRGKEASDGLEHGYLEFDTIREHAKEIRHRMALHVRKAIIELSELKDPQLTILLTDPFDEPIGGWTMAKYVRGKLLGKSEQLAAEGEAYPYLRWNPVIDRCVMNSEGKMDLQSTENLTAVLASGIEIKLGTIEVWQPG